MVHSRVDEDLQRIEEASAGAPEATSQKRFEKCEGKRNNGTYLSLVAGGKSVRNSETELYALPIWG